MKSVRDYRVYKLLKLTKCTDGGVGGRGVVGCKLQCDGLREELDTCLSAGASGLTGIVVSRDHRCQPAVVA